MVAMSTTLGASRAVIQSSTWDWPLHGLRHPPEAETTGWYLWTGDLQQDPNFFLPWRVAHALHRCPELGPLLELPPGSRFIYAPDYTDVWHDASLLGVRFGGRSSTRPGLPFIGSHDYDVLRGFGWHFGQKKLERFMKCSRTIGVPHLAHGRPT